MTDAATASVPGVVAGDADHGLTDDCRRLARQRGRDQGADGDELRRRRPLHQEGADVDAGQRDGAEDCDGAHRGCLAPRCRRPDEREEVLREAEAQCRREAGIDDEQGDPAVHERGPRAESLAQEHVGPAGLREARAQFGVAQRAGGAQQAHAQPDCGGRRGAAHRPEHRRRREKDADPHDVGHDHRRGAPGPQPARVAGQRHQNVTRTASCMARGPPDPNTPPAVETGWPNALERR